MGSGPRRIACNLSASLDGSRTYLWKPGVLVETRDEHIDARFCCGGFFGSLRRSVLRCSRRLPNPRKRVREFDEWWQVFNLLLPPRRRRRRHLLALALDRRMTFTVLHRRDKREQRIVAKRRYASLFRSLLPIESVQSPSPNLPLRAKRWQPWQHFRRCFRVHLDSTRGDPITTCSPSLCKRTRAVSHVRLQCPPRGVTSIGRVFSAYVALGVARWMCCINCYCV